GAIHTIRTMLFPPTRLYHYSVFTGLDSGLPFDLFQGRTLGPTYIQTGQTVRATPSDGFQVVQRQKSCLSHVISQVYLRRHLSYIGRVFFSAISSLLIYSDLLFFFCSLLFCISLSVGVSVITIFIFVSVVIEQNVN